MMNTTIINRLLLVFMGYYSYAYSYNPFWYYDYYTMTENYYENRYVFVIYVKGNNTI